MKIGINEITVGSIYDAIDAFAPFDTQMDFDNAGLLIGDRKQSVCRVLLSLDVTTAVVDEAVKKSCELIVSHHPVIFNPLRKIQPNDVVYKLISNGIAVISAHTNYDVAPEGVNRRLGEAIGLHGLKTLCPHITRYGYKVVVFVPRDYAGRLIEAMSQAGAGHIGNYSECAFSSDGKGQFRAMDGAQPFSGEIGIIEDADETRVEMVCSNTILPNVIAAMKSAHPYEQPAYDVLENLALSEEYASALCGELETKLSPQEFALRVKQALGCEKIKLHAGNRPIKTVGLCGGAGSDMMFHALSRTDAYVTSEVKHHEWLAAMEAGFTLIDAGHFSTEDIAIDPLRIRLAAQFPSIHFEKSASMTDPVQYI